MSTSNPPPDIGLTLRRAAAAIASFRVAFAAAVTKMSSALYRLGLTMDDLGLVYRRAGLASNGQPLTSALWMTAECSGWLCGSCRPDVKCAHRCHGGPLR